MNETVSQLNLTSQDFLMSQLNSADIPAGIMSISRIKKIDNMIIKSFKSFKEQTFTGPFLGFTSIVGPNGSGKSNILDALMFCLCGQNLKHNFFDLREYINREKAESYKEMSKKKKVCSVTVNFRLQNSQSISLKRQLDPESNQSFYIGKEQISKNIYQNFLFRQGINPHIPNYAITQGQIDKLLLKEPLELTHYIENLSGSFLFKKQYDLTREEINSIRKTLISLSQKIIKLKNDKRTAKNLNLASKDCQQLEKQYERKVNCLFLAKAYLKNIDLEEFQAQITKKKNQEKQKIDQINRRKLKIQEELREKQGINKQINLLERKILELNSKLKNLKRPDLALKTKQLEANTKQVQQMQNQLQNLNQKRRRLEQNLPKIHSTQIIEQYLSLFSQWERKNGQKNVELRNKKSLYFTLQSQLQFQRSLLQTQQDKQKRYKVEDQKRKNQIDSSKEQISIIGQVVQRLQEATKQQDHMLKKNQSLLREQKQQFQKIQNDVENLQELLTQDVSDIKDKQIIKRLCIVEGFNGMIEQKIRQTNAKYLVAFSILIAGISKYLLCKDQKSSKQISDKLKDMNSIKTLIILGNVKKFKAQENSIKQKVGKAGIESFDIVDFQINLEGIQSFMQQFCRGKVICDDLKTAFQIRNKKIPGLREIITLSGEILKNDGTITSCGNVQHIKRVSKLTHNKKSLEAQLQKILKTRDQFKEKIFHLEKQCKVEEQIKRNQQILKLQKKKLQLQNKIQYLSSVKPKQTKSFKIIERDIAILTQKIEKVEKQISSIQKSMSKDEQMSNFMKNHQIQNLQVFRRASNLEILQKQTKIRNQSIRQIDGISDRIEVIKQKLAKREQKINNLKQDLSLNGSLNDHKQIEKQIQQDEKAIKQLRSKVSKLAVFRETDIQLQSQVIEMQTKFKMMKQKQREFTEDLKIELGVSINCPRVKSDYKVLQEFLSSGAIEEINRKRIQKAVKDLLSQKKLSQDRLQKFNSMNLMSKDHQRDETEISTEIKTLTDAVTQHSERRRLLQEKIQKLKNERKTIFMSFFTTLKTNLKQCYEVLTLNQRGEKGKADIYLQNSDLPFQSGCYYTPTPPHKRFVYDLQQLSGGEKSIASLAIQYALAISTKAPFLVLDQSDAYLDSNNTAKLLKLLDQTFRGNMLQIVLITHKSTIFANCQSLVGVTRPQHQSSKIFAIKIK